MVPPPTSPPSSLCSRCRLPSMVMAPITSPLLPPSHLSARAQAPRRAGTHLLRASEAALCMLLSHTRAPLLRGLRDA